MALDWIEYHDKHCGNIKPIDNEHKLLKQPHILSK